MPVRWSRSCRNAALLAILLHVAFKTGEHVVEVFVEGLHHFADRADPVRCLPLLPQPRTGAGIRIRSTSIALAATRRDLLLGSGAALSSASGDAPDAGKAAGKPLCEMPLHRLAPVSGQVGGQFASVSASIQGEQVELMLDSGLSEGMVTPALAKQFRFRRLGSAQGEGAGGSAQVELVEIPDIVLGCGEKLAPITAAVSDFPQASADKGLPLNGMLGYRALQGYDVDIDFPRATLRLWSPGDGVATARAAGMREIKGVLLPELGILGVRVMVPGGGGAAAALGIIDTGATFSAVNNAAALALGAKVPAGSQELVVLGVDGRPLKLPLSRDVELPLGGAPLASGGWDTSLVLKADAVAMGELPALQAFAGAGKPSVLLGLDVLARRRIVFAAKSGGGEQQLFIGTG
mmetsp:Transcript_55498/g.180008  ORF Transcript_55498/g.180008 Transcript_55498/m.180008 type:complete len:406 (+) Transcript_55498:40-1257(+)